MANLKLLTDSRLRIAGAAMAILVGASLPSCAVTSGERIDGRVTNHLTGEPIADAFVIATRSYRGSDGYGSRSGCSGIEIVKTDAQGHFVVPAGYDVDVYKPGYSEFYSKTAWVTREEVEESRRFHEMVPFVGTPQVRAEEIIRYARNLDCKNPDIIATSKPLFQALDGELETLGLPLRYMRTLFYLQREIDRENSRRGTAK